MSQPDKNANAASMPEPSCPMGYTRDDLAKLSAYIGWRIDQSARSLASLAEIVSAATNDPQCQDCGDSMIDCPTCGYGMEANP